MRYLPFLLLLFSANTLAVTYYVSPTGNDGLAGTSHATAWQTVAQVNTFVFSSGDDVYFESNGTWTPAAELTIDWSGTALDRVVIGAYYWNGSTEVIGVSGSKPIIQGNFAGSSTVGVVGTPTGNGGVPSNRFDGLIEIGTDTVPQSYVTIQDFQTLDSAGRGIAIWNNLSTNNTIQRNFVKHAGSSCIATKGENTTIFDNETSQCSPPNLYDPVTHTDWQPCIYSNYINNVIENNYYHECWGEGIGVYKNTGYNIVRNNLGVAVKRSGLYSANSEFNIWENNKVIGDRTTGYTIGVPPTPVAVGATDGYVFADGWPGYGMKATSEEATVLNTDGNVYRNNLIANTGGCMGVGVNAGGQAQGKSSEGYFYGNTCAGNKNNALVTGFITNVVFEAKDNIFIYSDATGTTQDCNWNSVVATFDYNYWESLPADVDCRSANDIYGGMALNKSTGWNTVSLSNIPTDNDFKPADNTVLRQGVYLPTVIFNEANYADELLQVGCSLDLTQLSADHDCSVRTATTDMGAFHRDLTSVVIYSESTDGDLLSFLPMNQQTNIGSFGVGSSTVNGNVAISSNYRDSSDSFIFTVPANSQITSITLSWNNLAAYYVSDLTMAKINNIDTPSVFYNETSKVDFFDPDVSAPYSIFSDILPATEGTYNIRVPSTYKSIGDIHNMDWTLEFTVTAQ